MKIKHVAYLSLAHRMSFMFFVFLLITSIRRATLFSVGYIPMLMYAMDDNSATVELQEQRKTQWRREYEAQPA